MRWAVRDLRVVLGHGTGGSIVELAVPAAKPSGTSSSNLALERAAAAGSGHAGERASTTWRQVPWVRTTRG